MSGARRCTQNAGPLSIPDLNTKSPSITRTFLGWDRPLLELGARHLLGLAGRAQADGAGSGRPGSVLPDLGDTLVVVPTQNAGRRLREYLAALAAEDDTGILPPAFLTPEGLLNLGLPEEAHLAGGMLAQLTFALVLRELDLEEFRDLFPVDPVSRNTAWALGVASDLYALRQVLGERGLQILDVSRSFGLAETARWRNLAELERRYHARLEGARLTDIQLARRRALAGLAPPPGVDRIVVLGVADPLPQALRVLRQLAESTPVEICVFAPAEEAESFNEWGIPRVTTWSQRHLDLPPVDDCVHLDASTTAAAETTMRFLRASETPGETTAVGLLDTEAGALVENACTREKIPCYVPAGASLASAGPRHLLASLLEFLRLPEVRSFAEIARCPDVLAWIEASPHGRGFDASALPAQLDELHRHHLAAELEQLKYFAGDRENYAAVRAAVSALMQLDDRCRGDSGLTAAQLLRTIPAELLGARAHRADSPAAAAVRATLELAEETATLLETPIGREAGLDFPDALELLLRALTQKPVYKERPAKAVEFIGWLELLFEDAPHLVLLGFHDGIVPESVTSDPYLPEPLREKLGLKTNQARFARDAYFLTTMIESRRQAVPGRVDIILGKTNRQGESQRPSRLLFQCPREVMPERTARLFREVPHTGQNVPWKAAWKLRPEFDLQPEKVSVTAIKNYLECPFRFYLTNVLKMESVDPARIELDARGFGSFTHKILERYGKDKEIREITDPRMIAEWFELEVIRYADSKFGRGRSVPLDIQVASIAARLKRAARVEARERAAGWRIVKVEQDFKLPVQGIVISGIIDRIERHRDTGALRIIDFKTRDRGEPPKPAHCVSVSASTNRDYLPDYVFFQLNGKEHRWKDLQLPLYALALQAEGEGYSDEELANLQAGYFQLPRSLDNTRLEMWKPEEFNAELLKAAEHCATGVIADIQSQRFWPPAPRVLYENYEPLLFGNPRLTVEPGIEPQDRTAE